MLGNTLHQLLALAFERRDCALSLADQFGRGLRFVVVLLVAHFRLIKFQSGSGTTTVIILRPPYVSEPG